MLSPGIQPESSIQIQVEEIKISESRFSMLRLVIESEGLLDQAKAVAIAFARRNGRLRDGFFIQEAIAEAWYILWETLHYGYEGLLEKYPDISERHKVYRCRVGYGVKEYFSCRNTSTISKLTKLGIPITRVEYGEVKDRGRLCDSLAELEARDGIIRDEIERKIVEYKCMGNNSQLIADKLGCSLKMVLRTLGRIRRRLESCT